MLKGWMAVEWEEEKEAGKVENMGPARRRKIRKGEVQKKARCPSSVVAELGLVGIRRER